MIYKLSLFIIVASLFVHFSSCDRKLTDPNINEDEMEEPEMEYPSYVTLDYVMGKTNPAINDTFQLIDIKHADREGLYLRKDAYAAFVEMYNQAEKAGIRLIIRSAMRNFDYQKGIWENKWNGITTLSDGSNALTDYPDPVDRAIKILEYSAMPSTSRHHWGTDIDLNSFTNEWFESGDGAILYDWMLNHASEYGFCQPYTAKDENRPEGYNEEKWHWSYMPVSNILTQFAEEHFEDEYVTGFEGAGTATTIGVKEKYILGINKACR